MYIYVYTWNFLQAEKWKSQVRVKKMRDISGTVSLSLVNITQRNTAQHKKAQQYFSVYCTLTFEKLAHTARAPAVVFVRLRAHLGSGADCSVREAPCPSRLGSRL